MPLTVLLASPTVLVVVIAVTASFILWLVVRKSSSSTSSATEQDDKPQIPKRFPSQQDDSRKEKLSTPDRRVAYAKDESPSVTTPRNVGRGSLIMSGHNPLSGGPLTPRKNAALRKSLEFAPVAPLTPRAIKPAPYVNAKSPRKYYTMPATYNEEVKDQPSPTSPHSPVAIALTPPSNPIPPSSPRAAAIDLDPGVAQKLEDVAPTTPRGRAVTQKGFEELWQEAEEQQRRVRDEKEKLDRLKHAIAQESEQRHAEELRQRHEQLEKEAQEFEKLFAQAEQAKAKKAQEENEVLRQKLEQFRAMVHEHRAQQALEEESKTQQQQQEGPFSSTQEQETTTKSSVDEEPTVRLTPIREKKGKGRRRRSSQPEEVEATEKVIIADEDEKVIIADDEPSGAPTGAPAAVEETKTSAQLNGRRMTKRERREVVKTRQHEVNCKLQLMDERLALVEQRFQRVELWEDVPVLKKQRMREEIIRQAWKLEKIQEENVLYIFEWGSKWFGDARSDSDYDIVIVARGWKMPELDNVRSVADWDMDLVFWSEEWFRERLELQHSWVLAMLCYSPQSVWICREPIQIDIDPVRLETTVRDYTTLHISIGKGFWAKGNIRKSKKRICFVVRMLSYAIQLRTHGRLVDPRPLLPETNRFMTCPAMTWHEFRETWYPLVRELLHGLADSPRIVHRLSLQ